MYTCTLHGYACVLQMYICILYRNIDNFPNGYTLTLHCYTFILQRYFANGQLTVLINENLPVLI